VSAPIAPVEVSTRYATTVESLADAWEFVMSRIDLVGPDPSVTISPYWRVNMDLITMEDSVEEKACHGASPWWWREWSRRSELLPLVILY
jgi:hypothetical protein